MRLTEQRRRETGAFYTPTLWAEKAARTVERFVPEPGWRWADGAVLFYDPAAGEGSLLDALQELFGGCLTCGTTLEEEDAEMLRRKGHLLARAADFLADTPLSHIVPPAVSHAARDGRLVVLTNPPFLRLPAGQHEALKRRYASNEASELFLARILMELKPALTFSFSKTAVLQSPMSRAWREKLHLTRRLLPGSLFLSPSDAWPGLHGHFPILFAGYT